MVGANLFDEEFERRGAMGHGIEVELLHILDWIVFEVALGLSALAIAMRPAAHDPRRDAARVREHDFQVREILEKPRKYHVRGSEAGFGRVTDEIDEVILAEGG